MSSSYIPECEMNPHIRVARLFDTKVLPEVSCTPLRTVECWELSIYVSGGGHAIINGVDYPISKNDVKLTRCGQVVCSKPHYSCYSVYFDFPGFDASCTNEILESIPVFFHTCGSQRPIFEKLVDCYNSGITGSIAMQNALLLELLCHYYNSHISRIVNKTVNQCTTYMQKNFSEPVTLEDLGRLTGYSALHVLRLFKASTGQTPHSYLSSLRMAHARQLLSETSIPVSTIASECGFSSESYFQTFFRKTNNMSPGEYRRSANIL